mgnify:CR=1 FL=1
MKGATAHKKEEDGRGRMDRSDTARGASSSTVSKRNYKKANVAKMSRAFSRVLLFSVLKEVAMIVFWPAVRTLLITLRRLGQTLQISIQ